MATNTLFDSENQNSSSSKVFLIVIGFLVVLSAGGFGLWKCSDDTKAKNRRRQIFRRKNA